MKKYVPLRIANDALPLTFFLSIEEVQLGRVLHAHDGTDVSLSFKIELPCSNNEDEYKTLVTGLISTLQIETPKLCVQGDSKLIIKRLVRNLHSRNHFRNLLNAV